MENEIFYYIINKDLKSIKKLVESTENFNLEIRCDYDSTPLHISVNYGHLDIVKYLISVGVDIESKDVDGFTSLHIASIYSDVEIIKHLLLNGADPYVVDKFGTTPIDYYDSREEFLNLIRLCKLEDLYE